MDGKSGGQKSVSRIEFQKKRSNKDKIRGLEHKTINKYRIWQNN